MIFNSHRGVAILVALVAVAISIGCTLVFDGTENLVIVLIINAGALVLLYFFLSFLLQQFIIKKITPIYRTIYNMGAVRKNLRNRSGDIVEQVKQDVTNWAEEQAKEISRLAAMEQYRKEFLGNVSHELKTPTFAIQGQILTLLDGGLEDPSINRKYLESCERNIERLITLIQDLEIINKLETGEMPLHKTSFSLPVLVEEVFDTLAVAAEKKSIKLRMHTPIGGKAMVYADRKRILQIVTNLVSNSIKYGHNGGEAAVSFADVPDRILVEIKDNGIGIAPGNLPRIFERFYRVDKHRSREHGGSGLGLAIVKHIIEAHEQTINVKSELGKGATFAFTLEKS